MGTELAPLLATRKSERERDRERGRIKDGNNFENEKKKEICNYMSEHA